MLHRMVDNPLRQCNGAPTHLPGLRPTRFLERLNSFRCPFEVVDDFSRFRPRAPLDTIVGRLILMYFGDPASILNHLVPYIGPDGLIVFQELALVCAARSHPVPSWRNAADGVTIHPSGRRRRRNALEAFRHLPGSRLAES
ncbi:MAG: hypothetical protein JO334_19365 [Verrucomicrobia bacterium]|nr:hypothetical protein [Verrucomicrobiota bacterium]